jgi:hypothetical protein
MKGSVMSEPEVLIQFSELVLSNDRMAYRAQACGTAIKNGLWEGWIEFIPVAGGPPVRSPRETTQSHRVDAVYWARGLSLTYLEGALDRALRGPIVKPTVRVAQPHFDSPAPEFHTTEAPGGEVRAILDPFSVYDNGETLLRQELRALSPWHLVNIIVAYRLSDQSVAVLNGVSQPALIDLIVAGVREHSLQRP